MPGLHGEMFARCIDRIDAQLDRSVIRHQFDQLIANQVGTDQEAGLQDDALVLHHVRDVRPCRRVTCHPADARCANPGFCWLHDVGRNQTNIVSLRGEPVRS